MIRGHLLIPVRLCDETTAQPAQLLHHARLQRGWISFQLDHGTVGLSTQDNTVKILPLDIVLNNIQVLYFLYFIQVQVHERRIVIAHRFRIFSRQCSEYFCVQVDQNLYSD